jgi:hypothetical protein
VTLGLGKFDHAPPDPFGYLGDDGVSKGDVLAIILITTLMY